VIINIEEIYKQLTTADRTAELHVTGGGGASELTRRHTNLWIVTLFRKNDAAPSLCQKFCASFSGFRQRYYQHIYLYIILWLSRHNFVFTILYFSLKFQEKTKTLQENKDNTTHMNKPH
jgi:hypothetical protein